MYSLLLVDDEPLALAGMRNIIDWERYGFRVADACVWPEDALERARELHPDVLVTDLRMPEMDGMELYQEICRTGWKPELVIVSAYSDFEVARTAIEYGAAAYILKPLQEEEVARVAERLKEKLAARDAAGAEEPLSADDPEELTRRLKEMNLPPFRRLLAGGGAPPEAEGGVTLPLRGAGLPDMWLLALPSRTVPEGLLRSGRVFVPEEGKGKRTLRAGEGPESPVENGEDSVLWTPEGRAPGGEEGGPDAGIMTPAEEDGDPGMLLAQARAALQGGFRYSVNDQAARIQFYIGTHYAEPLSLDSISGCFYLSGTYLSNFFKKNTGVNLIAFLNHVRVHQACRLLERGDLRLKEAAAAVGYHDYGHFNRQFRRVMGCAPEQWAG